MSIVTHVIVGAAAGSFVPTGLMGAGVGFVSHIMGDLIPHYDPPFLRKNKPIWETLVYCHLLVIDLFLGLVMLYLLRDYPSLFWGGLVGGLVDLDSFFFHKLKDVGIPIHDINSGWHKKTTMIKGLFNQGVLTLVALTVIAKFLDQQHSLPDFIASILILFKAIWI